MRYSCSAPSPADPHQCNGQARVHSRERYLRERDVGRLAALWLISLAFAPTRARSEIVLQPTSPRRAFCSLRSLHSSLRSIVGLVSADLGDSFAAPLPARIRVFCVPRLRRCSVAGEASPGVQKCRLGHSSPGGRVRTGGLVDRAARRLPSFSPSKVGASSLAVVVGAEEEAAEGTFDPLAHWRKAERAVRRTSRAGRGRQDPFPELCRAYAVRCSAAHIPQSL